MNKPAPSPPDLSPSDAVLTWAVSLCEPLLSTERRIVLDDQIRRICRVHPDWACIFFAGVVADLIGTLPTDDAWRHLSARIELPGKGSDLVRGQIPRPPDRTGAVRRGGQPFGTYEDSTDLNQPIFSNLDIDVAFAALMEPIGKEASALIAFSADGWRKGLDAMRAIRELAVAESVAIPAGVEFPERWISARAEDIVYTCVVEAVRSATHRRRTYAGMGDPWVVESCFAWSWRADRISAGTADEAMYGEIESGIARETVTREEDDF